MVLCSEYSYANINKLQGVLGSLLKNLILSLYSYSSASTILVAATANVFNDVVKGAQIQIFLNVPIFESFCAI